MIVDPAAAHSLSGARDEAHASLEIHDVGIQRIVLLVAAKLPAEGLFDIGL